MKIKVMFLLIFTGLALVFSCSDPKAKAAAKVADFFTALEESDMAKLEELAEEVDVNTANAEGLSALHLAINKGNKGLLVWLLDKKADVMARNSQGETAYQAAVSQNKGELALLLLSHGQLVNRKAWITAPEGLRFRDNPGLDSNRLGVVPHGEEVLVIKTSTEEFSISGDRGKWAYIDWNGKKGWVFDAYISFEQDLSLVLFDNPKFRAGHLSGADKSRPAVSESEQVHFLDDSRCAYYRTQYFSTSTAESVQRGIYTIEGNKVVLLLDQGTKITTKNDGAPGKKEELTSDQKILVWKDELGGFLHQADYDKLENSDFILDEVTHQLKKESASDFEYVGYFYRF